MPNLLFKETEKNVFSLDRVVAMLLLAAGIIIIFLCVSWLNYYQIHLFVIISAASLFYLLLREKIFLNIDYTIILKTNRIYIINHIVFILSLSFSIWLLWENLYYRPPLYFALVLITAASIISDIWYLNEEKNSSPYMILFKIIVLSLCLYAGIYWEFPGLIGADVWWHHQWIKETIELGHITEGYILRNSYYYMFPIFHQLGTINSILTSLSVRSSVFVSTGILMAISCLLVYLIGKIIINKKIALLAALIVPLTDWAIVFGTSVIPNTLGFFFFGVILFLIFHSERKTLSEIILIIILSIVLILTHTISAFIMLFTVSAIFLAIKIYKRTRQKNNNNYELVSLSFITLFGITMITRWMQNPPWGTAFFDLTLSSLLKSLQTEIDLVIISPVQTGVPYIVSLLNGGAYFLLLFFGTIGALIYLHPRNRTELRVALIATLVSIILLPYFFMLIKLRNIVPERWFIFLYVPLSILATQGILSIFNIFKSNYVKIALVTLAVLSILTLMVINNPANSDSPWVYNGAERAGYTQSELVAIQTLSNMKCGCPKTDLPYGNILPYIIDNNDYLKMVNRKNQVFIVRNYYLHNPEWNVNYRMQIHEGGGYDIYKSGKVIIFDYLKKHGIDKQPLIYQNGNVWAYTIP